MSAPGPKNLKITAAERPNTLGLHQRELVQMLEKLEGADKGKAPVRREFARWPFRQATIKVALVQPSGADVVLKLACRNLSRGGISLLHNAYVHPGSTVVVTIPRLTGGFRDVPGVVKRCQHRRAVLHEIGVRFDEQLDLREFLGGGAKEFFSLENVDTEHLKGNVMYVEDCDVDARILGHFLRETQINLVRTKTAAEALADCGRGFDIFLVDYHLPDMKGTELIAKMRDAGITAPAMLTTADPVGLMRDSAWDQRSTGLLAKPLQQTTLLRAFAERMLIKEDTPVAGESGESDAAVLAPGMAGLFQDIAGNLQKALAASDTNALTNACMQVCGSAPSLGLKDLARTAENALGAIRGGESKKVERLVKDLADLCKRVAA